MEQKRDNSYSQTEESSESSYPQIVKTTGVFGGSQVVSVLAGVVRNKVVALLVGTTGVGLISVYNSIIDTVRSVSSLGLDFSAVRDLSQASANDDMKAVASTAVAVKRWMLFTAMLGALLTLVMAGPISMWAFHDREHVVPVCCLSFAVFMTTLSALQRTVLQGLRRVGDMARASVYGALLSLAAFSVLLWFFGLKGIVPALIAASLAAFACSTFYVVKVRLPKVSQLLRETIARGKDMVRLGVYSMLAGIVGSLSLLILKGCMGRWGGIEVVGLFQSASSLSSVAIASVLTAMSADYYPRLCQVSHDNDLMCKRVKEQVRVGVILSSVVVVAMMLFTPLLLQIFFSNKFVPAESMLRWQMAGCWIKALSWPLGFVILSKGKGMLFFLTEVFSYAMYLGGCFLLWPSMGLEGTGLAFLISNLLYALLLLCVAGRLCNYRIDKDNMHIEIFSALQISAAFIMAVYIDNEWLKYLLSSLLLIFALIYTLYEFNEVYPLRVLWNNVCGKFLKS